MMDEYSSDDVEPIEIVEMSLTAFGDLQVHRLKAMLSDTKAPAVVLLHDGRKQPYALVTPISFQYLLEVRAVLKDETMFQKAPEALLAGL